MLTVAKVVAYFSLQINLECGKGRWEVNYPLARRSSTEVQVIPPAAYAIITGICHSQATVHPAPIPACCNGLFFEDDTPPTTINHCTHHTPAAYKAHTAQGSYPKAAVTPGQGFLLTTQNMPFCIATSLPKQASLLMMPSPQQALASNISPHNPLCHP